MSSGNDGVLVNQDIVDAILTHHLLGFTMKATAEKRAVEPHRYGITHDGHHVLMGWRVSTGREPSVQEGWELVRLDEMRDVQILAGTFEGHRPDYKRGDKEMRLVHSQL